MAKKGQISSGNPLHPIFHEAGHCTMGACGVDRHGQGFLTNTDRATAGLVSRRATKDQDEFLAEVFAAKMAGVKLDRQVLDLYRRLGGT